MGVVEETVKFLMQWAAYGIVVMPVCDGDTRPITKIASHKNRAKREKSRISAIVNRRKLNEVTSRLNSDGLTAGERASAISEQKSLEAKIKRAETQSTNPVPLQFPALLAAELERANAHNPMGEYGGYVARVKTAEFQADGVIAGRYTSGCCDLIASTDADFLGFTDDNCISVTSFKSSNLVLSSTSKDTLLKAKSFLTPDSRAKVQLESPSGYPIFEGANDLRTRCLIGVMIGCDVSPGGISGVGPEKVWSKLQEIRKFGCSNEDTYEQMIEYAVDLSKPSRSKDAVPKYNNQLLNTLVDAIVYEPTNELSEVGRTYLSGEPLCLPAYLDDFKCGGTKIEDGPAVIECKGPSTDGSACHKFLAAETNHKCKDCGSILCEFCCLGLDVSEYRCFGCYVLEAMLPCPNVDVREDMQINDMRLELKDKYGFDRVDELTAQEVIDIWEAHALHREIEKLADSFKFPVLPTSSLTASDRWQELCEIDFSLGGSFIINPDIDETHIPAILELMASFVTFYDKGTKHTKWQQDGPVFAAIPKMFIDFANECRVDIGYRLLRRCLRHAFDSKTESLDNKIAKLLLYEGKIGIMIETPIPASMKKEKYSGCVVLTKDELLCCECDCKSGSKGDQRVACVHSFPRGFLLSILLAEDLAEHLLLELSSLVTSPDIEQQSGWNSDQINIMKKSITTLIRASGNNSLADMTTNAPTVYDMLQTFRTGTQRQKEWNRPSKPPTEDHKGPIDLMFLDSPEYKSKMKFNIGVSKKNRTDRDAGVQTFDPDYIVIDRLLEAAGLSPSRFSPIGFKLFQHRLAKSKAITHIDGNSEMEVVDALKKQWISLMETAESRSNNNNQSMLSNKNAKKRKSDDLLPTSSSDKSTTRQSVRLLALELKKNDEHPPKKKRKNNSGKKVQKCAKIGCNVTEKEPGVSFHRLPPYPDKPAANASFKSLVTYRGQRWIREEMNDRCGLSRNNKSRFESL